jgi:hypothetical protein
MMVWASTVGGAAKAMAAAGSKINRSRTFIA